MVVWRIQEFEHKNRRVICRLALPRRPPKDYGRLTCPALSDKDGRLNAVLRPQSSGRMADLNPEICRSGATLARTGQ